MLTVYYFTEWTQWQYEKTFSVIRTKIKVLTYSKTINIFKYAGCQTKNVSSMITKETWIIAKVAKSCDMFKLNQNWSLKL